MPKFQLNSAARGSHPFYALDDFAKGYVEAMFFTNGDTGEDDEFLLNHLGVEALTHDAVKAIKRDCDTFLASLPKDGHGRTAVDLACDYCAGNDFWYTRQGHGVGFWDRGLGPIGDELEAASKAFSECYVEVHRERVYVR